MLKYQEGLNHVEKGTVRFVTLYAIQRLGHDPSQILMKLFEIKGVYEIRLS